MDIWSAKMIQTEFTPWNTALLPSRKCSRRCLHTYQSVREVLDNCRHNDERLRRRSRPMRRHTQLCCRGGSDTSSCIAQGPIRTRKSHLRGRVRNDSQERSSRTCTFASRRRICNGSGPLHRARGRFQARRSSRSSALGPTRRRMLPRCGSTDHRARRSCCSGRRTARQKEYRRRVWCISPHQLCCTTGCTHRCARSIHLPSNRIHHHRGSHM